jgi:hypothetical protein
MKATVIPATKGGRNDEKEINAFLDTYTFSMPCNL